MIRTPLPFPLSPAELKNVDPHRSPPKAMFPPLFFPSFFLPFSPPFFPFPFLVLFFFLVVDEEMFAEQPWRPAAPLPLSLPPFPFFLS